MPRPIKGVPMKKKHLRSLNSIQKWLQSNILDFDHLQDAFWALEKAIESVEESPLASDGILPPPLEIYGESNTLALYSDGGCRGNPGPGSFAYVIQEHNGDILAEGVEFEAFTTNNKMELSGPLHGLRELENILPNKGRDPRLTKVKVMTDSKYVVDGMKSWVEGWKSRGWKKADNKAPENLELWQSLDEMRTHFLQVEWVWIKGHAGHPQNEYCDKKANEVMDAHHS